jgi:hypothetical protein
MNKTVVINKVSEQTGIAADACEKVIKAFEEQAGDILAAKLKGLSADNADILTGMSEKVGIAKEDCQKVLIALQGVVQEGISDKLGAFAKLFSKS